MVARAAHAMAMESSQVIADVIEGQEFPYLSQRYGVRGVPMTVINEKSSSQEPHLRSVLTDRILKALGELDDEDDKQEQGNLGETSSV